MNNLEVSLDNQYFDSRGNCNAIISTASDKLVVGCSRSVIPNGIRSIGENAFFFCSIEEVFLPASVTEIENHAFGGCQYLSAIGVSSDNLVYDSRDNCNAIVCSASDTLIVGCKKTVIPQSVKTIEDMAFYYCTYLTSVDIPEGVKRIGKAFVGCSQLRSVNIPNSVVSFNAEAFCGCTNLPVVDGVLYAGTFVVGVSDKSLIEYHIKDGTRFIASSAFSDCKNMVSIHIPESMMIICSNNGGVLS